MTKQIRSLDELSKGDVVMSDADRPYVVHAIGDVPEHEKEVVLCRLIEPRKNYNALTDEMQYPTLCLNESDLVQENKIRIHKENSADYSGWKYFSPEILS
jgi:hypothetical protein